MRSDSEKSGQVLIYQLRFKPPTDTLQRTTCYCIPIELESLEKTKGKRTPNLPSQSGYEHERLPIYFSQFTNIKGLCMKTAEPTARLTTSGIKKWVQQL